MSTEDRKASRLESAQFISYRLYDRDGRVCEEGIAKTKDISRTGVAVENRTAFDVGSIVELTIALSEELIKTDAVVRNIQKLDDNAFQIGLEFTKITEEEIQKLGEEFPSIL